MRRLLRRLVNGLGKALCLLSLLACVGTAWLWRRSYRGQGDKLSLRLSGEQYVLRSESGRVTVWGLPPPKPHREEGVRRWLAGARDGDLRWTAVVLNWPAGPIGTVKLVEDSMLFQRLDTVLRPSAAEDDCRPLFEALDDPERFMLAHVALQKCRRWVPEETDEVRFDRGGRWVEGSWDGQWIRLPSTGRGWDGDPFALTLKPADYFGPAAEYDASRIPSRRRLWFDRLAVPVATADSWLLVAASSVPPLLWLALRSRHLPGLRRRRRRRLGLCLRCGYDLRGNTSGKCSECGEAVEAERRVTACPTGVFPEESPCSDQSLW